jgi:hypothetical protein
MAKKGGGKRDKGADFDLFNEIQEPGVSLDDLLQPLDGSVLDDLLPPGDESVLDALLPPLDASFLDGLLPPPNEIVIDDFFEGIHVAMDHERSRGTGKVSRSRKFRNIPLRSKRSGGT